jgi:Xaa-Pro aminopeptidase
MKQLDFEPQEFADRLRRTRAALADNGVDAMLVHDPASIYWLTGWRGKGYQIYQALVVTVEDSPLVLLTRTSDVHEARSTSTVDELYGWRSEADTDPFPTLARILADRTLLSRRLAYDLPTYYLSVPHYLKLMALLSETRTANLSGLIDSLRYRRSPAEIAYVRRSAAINDIGVEACTAALAAGKTELEVAGAIHQAMMAAGAGSPASVMNFASGHRAAFSHAFPSERVLERGDFIQAEWGANYRAYHTTIGRMWSLGEPSRRIRELYPALRAANDAVIEGARPGVPMRELDAAALRELGTLSQYASHKTGYLIKAGFPPAWGDTPSLAPDDTTLLEQGMLCSVEPPIFIPDEQIGLRIIDNILITDTGAELLSKASRDIVVVGG